MLKGKYTLFYFLLFMFSMSYAQEFAVQARIDSSLMLIGEQTRVRFEISQMKAAKVQAPLFSDTLTKGLELIKQLPADTIDLGHGRIQVNLNYIVTAFDSALYYIPPFRFISGTDTVESNPLSLKVYSVQIDTTKEGFFDIKPIYKAKFDWKTFWFRALYVFLGLLFVFLAYVLVRKFIQKKPLFSEPIPEPELQPHIWAQAELDRIKSEKLWQQGRVKEFYTQLTDVLRHYIERRFEINAPEMTTDEILEGLVVDVDLQKSSYEMLKQILQLGDLVKFAKFLPFVSENELSLMNAFLFVNQTKIEEIESVDEINKENHS